MSAAINVPLCDRPQIPRAELVRTNRPLARARTRVGFSRYQYLRGMEHLVGVVQELSLARDLATIQLIVRNAARDLTGADGATFVLRDNDKCYYADENAIAPLWKGMRFPIEACISGWAMLNSRAAVIADIYKDPRVPADAYRPTFVKSLVMVPIRTLDPVGAIGNYWATIRRPSEREVRLLQALADTTAVAMENVQVFTELEHRVQARTSELRAANEEIRRLSLIDELTTLHNRRGFFILAGQARKLANRTGKRAVIVFIDVDGLKRINDNFGHAAGDAILRDFAGVLKSTFRDSDIVARLGGDEFCVFAHDDPDPEQLVARLQLNIAAYNATHPAPFALAASAGVWPCPTDESDPLEHVISSADECMYEHKRARRAKAASSDGVYQGSRDQGESPPEARG